MKISVALATYNGERFIRQQLESLAGQTRLPDELVVTDDCSSDCTLEIVAEFARTAPFPVRIYRNDRNIGYGDNFLRAAELCVGDWIAYCDQDDVWLSGKLATIEQYANWPNREIMMVAHSGIVVDENLTLTDVREPNIRRLRICRNEQLPGLWYVSGFAIAFRGDVIRSLSPWDRGPDGGVPSMPLAHDVWTCRLARILGDIVLLPDDLCLYRRHKVTTTSAFRGNVAQIRHSRRMRALFANALASGANEYNNQSRAIRHQAQAFGELSRLEIPEGWRDKLLVAEVYYSDVADWLQMRGRLYRERRLVDRARVLSWLIRRKGYTRYIGHRAFSKDLFIALVGGRRFSGNAAYAENAEDRD